MKNGPYEMVVAPWGYPGFKYRGRYCYEHTLVWWKRHGEVPGPDECLHHLNGNKRDNRIENLSLEQRGEHTGIHSRGCAKPMRHGTLNAYKHHGCRCRKCRAANAAYTRSYRSRESLRVGETDC